MSGAYCHRAGAFSPVSLLILISEKLWGKKKI